jgi:DNA processing protein
MNNELLHRVALTLVPHIGAVQARILVEHFGDAKAIFNAKKSTLGKLEGIGEVRANAINQFRDFATAEAEIAFMEKYAVTPLFITETNYPKRLLNCYDPPTMLYYRGEADLNATKIIALVGTRDKTEYGKQLTEKLLHDLSDQQVLVVSGLALGIDAVAHKAAIKNNLPTVGVLAHGLDKMYPLEHTPLAREMIKHGGGLLTESRSNTKPDKHNFPTRNRVVAGMCDAVIVVETGIKGGSIITAELANGYNRDVFAFPGKITDAKSAGCNYLIQRNKAILLTGASDLLQIMGWQENTIKPITSQKELFIQLTTNEKKVIDILNEKESAHIDELNLRSGISSSSVAAAVLNLELQNIIVSMPGKLYKKV